MLFSTKLRAILALAPLSLALPQVGSPDPYWGITFYYSGDCTGPSPAAFGDNHATGCNNIGSSATLMSARGGEGLGVSSGNYEIWVYDGTDCTGDGALLAETGQCAQPNAEVGHFLSFNVFVKN